MCMVDKERWKQVDGYENYEVSSFGKVRNKNTGRILKPACKGGYMYVGLSLNGKIKTTGLHRLVALAFIENPENKPHVNHKDKNRSNNNIFNLEWCTAMENNIHKSSSLQQKTNQNLKVWRVDKNTNEKLELHNSIYDAAIWCVENNHSSSANISRANISSVMRGLYKSSCGFKWIMDDQVSLENEIWKNVVIDGKTFENYFVSNLGRFKNSKGVIMENYKPHHSGYIYLRVNKEKYALHRLVAFAFIENPENKPVVNHIDGCKTNNCVFNLEWCTIKENNQHNHNAGLIKVYTRRVAQYNLNGDFVKKYNSIVDAEKEIGVQTIKKVLHNKQKTAGGFLWKYLE
jgi:hypothetical protein